MQPPSTPRPWYFSFAALFLLLCGAISYAGYLYYDSFKQSVQASARERLAAIVDLKVRQVTTWRKERLADGHSLLANSMIMAALYEAIHAPDGSVKRRQAAAWLEVLRTSHGYSNAILLDSKGDIRVQSGPLFGDRAHLAEVIRGLRDARDVVFRDLRRDSGSGRAYLAINIPLRTGKEEPPFGALLLGIDPNHFLYPLIQTWPTPSRTAETLLVRREGDEVVFLNELRHRKGTAIELRLPITETRAPAVQAVLGRAGPLDGTDYRGVPVLAAAQPVRDTNWYLVAKVDAAEVDDPVRQRSKLLLVTIAALIATAATGIGLLMQMQSDRHRRQQYEAEVERRALLGHFDYLSRHANDIIFLFDDSGRTVEANERAVASYGYTRDELLRMMVSDLRTTDSMSDFERQWNAAGAENGIVFETWHRRKDGSTFPVEVSSRPVDVDGVVYRQSIVRDITERKQAENSLRQAYDLLGRVIQASPVPIVVHNLEGQVRVWNKAAEATFGWTKEEVIGNLLPFIPPSKQDEARQNLERVERGESISGLELERQRKDGSPVTISLYTAPIPDESGNVVEIMAVLMDVTEQRRAEKALQESEERFRATFEQAAVGMALCGLDGRFLRVNQKFCDISGYTWEELASLSFGDITHPDDIGREMEIVGRFLAGELSDRSYEKRYVRKEGTVIWVRLTVSVARYPSGLPAQCLGVVEDITERKQAEKALLDSEERYRKVVDSASLGIFVQTGLRFRYLNPTAVRLLGAANAEELIGRPVLELLHPDYHDLVRDAISSLTTTTTALPLIDQKFLRVDGTPFEVEVSAVAFDYEGEKGSLVFFGDITARKQAEAARARLEEQFRQAQKMESIGRLAGGVAHDFNNHLTVINGYCDLILRKLKEGDALRDQIAQIRAAGQRAGDLTRQLLAFSRKQVIELAPLDLNGVIRDIVRMAGRLIGENVRLITMLEPALGTVMADRGQIEQVLMNLVVNARDAMPGGGTLILESANVEVDEAAAGRHEDMKPGGYVLLTLTDTGIGMDAATRSRIFEPFFTTKGPGEGTGLGLSTAYGIVKQCGGWIWLYSEPGKGACFKIYLPRISAPIPKELPDRAAASDLRGTETVLLVEDQPDVRRVSREILAFYGYQVLEAASGEEALIICKQHSGTIHVMITDVVMPGMNGRELGRLAAEIRPGMKVLFVSGYTQNAIVHHGVLEPGLAYLPKPLSPDTLARKLRELLD